MRAFFRDRIVPHVPEKLRMGLSFEQLWDAFGGKLAHWQDYITDYGMFSAHLHEWRSELTISTLHSKRQRKT